MTKFAIVKIAFAESPFVVVTGHTFHRPPGREMLRGFGRAHLSGLRRARDDRVAVGAVQTLPRSVVGV